MPKKPPYFPFYPKDFIGDDKVMAMCTEARGAYLLLLCAAWVAEPPATIPADDTSLARLTGLPPDRWAELKSAVLAPWSAADESRLVQPRLLREYEKAMALINRNRANGRKGGRPPGKREEKRSVSSGLTGGFGLGFPDQSQSESESEIKKLNYYPPPDAAETQRKPRDNPPVSGESSATPDPAPVAASSSSSPKTPPKKPRPKHWSHPHDLEFRKLDGCPKQGPYSFLAQLARQWTQQSVLAALKKAETQEFANWRHARGWLHEASRKAQESYTRHGNHQGAYGKPSPVSAEYVVPREERFPEFFGGDNAKT